MPRSEAFDDVETPPQTPLYVENHVGKTASGLVTPPSPIGRASSGSEIRLNKGQALNMGFERPFYGIIVDGIHSHPNSVRVREDTVLPRNS